MSNSVLAGQLRKLDASNPPPFWWVWPVLFPFLATVGLGGLVRSIYKGWWHGVAFTVTWLVLLVSISGPPRRAWLQHRSDKKG
jgi:hypothetical protein